MSYATARESLFSAGGHRAAVSLAALKGRFLVSLLTLLVLPLALAFPARSQVVDGDLSDLEALQQAQATDLLNDVCPAGKSGFDFERVLVYYDSLTDRLFVGLDLFDVPPGTGLPGPGVPGDADGDNDPSTMTNPACLVKVDQPGVGPDETYVVSIDTNQDQNFESSNDVRVEFRGNLLRLATGDGSPLPNDPNDPNAAWVLMVLGTAGTGGIDTPIPNEGENPTAYENPLTEDIELVIHNFSKLDTIPQCFRLQVFAGSLRDLLPEDRLTTPLIFDPFTADISLMKEARNVTQVGDFDPDTVFAGPGDTVRFRITVTNNGEIPLRDIMISDLLPPGFSGLQSGDPKCVISGNSINCIFGGLSIGESRQILYEAVVVASPGVDLINDAQVTASTPPEECRDRTVEDSDQVTTRVVGVLCDKQASLDGVNFQDTVTGDTGQTVFFRVVVTNDSALTLTSVTVLDDLPVGFVDVASDDPRLSIAGNLVFGFLEDLSPGASTTVLYRARIEATNPPTSSLTNVATITALAGNFLATSTCTSTVDLNTIGIECDKNATVDGVTYSDRVIASPGQRVGFEVLITNTGSASFFNVNIQDVLPAGFVDPISDIAGCSFQGSSLSCDLGPLLPGGSIRVTYSARVAAQVDQDLTNTVTVTGVVGDPGNPGVSASGNCIAVTQVRNPAIRCEKLISIDGMNFSNTMPVVTGQSVFFLLRIVNEGTVDFFSSSIVDDVPAGFSNLVSTDGSVTIVGNQVTCSVGALPAGGAANCTFQAVVSAANPPTAELVNTGIARGTAGTPQNPANLVSSTCPATLPLQGVNVTCDKNASLDGITYSDSIFALPGDTVFFEVIVTNTGQANFFQVLLNDLLPDGYVNPSTSDSQCSFVGNQLSCNLGQLPIGSSTRVTYQADVSQTAVPPLVNTAMIVATPGLESNPGNSAETSCSATVDLLDPDISCLKEVSLSFLGPFGPSTNAVTGQKVFFRVTVSNDSDSALTFDSVRLTDVLPPGFSDVELLFGSCDVTGNVITCDDLGALPQGGQVVVVYSAIVSATNPPTDTLTNIAVVEAVIGGTTVDTDTCTATVGIPQADISCSKVVSADGVNFSQTVSASPGQIMIFRVDVTNTGMADLFSVTLQDTLPAGYENPLSLDNRCQFTGNQLNCDLGPLAAGQSTTVLYIANLRSDASGMLRNTASVTGTPGTMDNPGTPVTSECSADVTVLVPGLDCVKLVSLNGVQFLPSVSAAPLQMVQFRVDLTNTGTAPLFAVSLNDVLPDGFDSVQVISGNCTAAGNTVTCADLGTLAPGQTISVVFQARITASPPNDPLVNAATVSATSGTPDNPGVLVGDVCEATVDILDVRIECVKEASLDGTNFSNSLPSVATGQLVTFRVTISNPGEVRFSDNVTLSDILPAGFSDLTALDARCSASGNSLSCTGLGPIEPGASVTVLYQARVTATPPATLVNTANVTGVSGTSQNPGAEDSTSCSATVTLGTPGLICVKQASLDGVSFASSVQVLSGQDQEVTFRVTLTNNGNVPLFEASLTDVLPVGFDNVVSLDPRCTVSGNTFSCTGLGPLGPAESTSVDYRARVIATNPPTDLLTNTATISGTPGTPDNPGDPVGESCQATVEILDALLRCEKMVSANGVDFFPAIGAAPGQTVTFKVTVFNDSSSDLTFDPVAVTDELPAEYENVEVVSGSCSVVGNSLSCSIGPIAPSGSEMIVYRAKLRDDVSEGAVVVNTAMVSTSVLGVTLDSSCSATVTAQPASAECVKEASLDGVNFSSSIVAAPRQRVFFRVRITNTGTLDFFTVSFSDTLPAGYEDVISETAGCTVTGNSISCSDLGPLPVGSEIVVEYRAQVNRDVPGGTTLTNVASFVAIPGSLNNPGNPVGDQCQAETLVADVSIDCDKQASLDGVSYSTDVTANPGQRVFFRVVVTNNGDADLFTSDLQDVLPVGFVDPQTSTSGCSFTGNTLSCDLGPIAAGDFVTVLYSARVGSGVTGNLVNRVTVGGRGGSPENMSLRVTDTCSATVIVVTPNIQCVKQVSLDDVSYFDRLTGVPGQLLFFQVVVTNPGPVDFESVTLVDVLPNAYLNPAVTTGGCAFVGQTLTCDLGSLLVGEQATVNYMATLSENATGTIENVAMVTASPGPAGNPGDDAESECSALVDVEDPAITCIKEVSRDGVTYSSSVEGQVGVFVFYRVTVRNTGSADFFDTSLVDQLPLALTEVETSDPDCDVVDNTITCDLGALAAGEERVVLYSARIASLDDDIDNVAVVTGVPGTVSNPGTPKMSQCTATIEGGPRRIPTLSEWGLILMGALLGVGLVVRRGRVV